MRRLYLCLLLAVGCADSGAPLTTDSPGDETSLPQVSSPQVGVVPGLPEPEEPGRQRRRMSIAQVRDSMERVAGGVVWGEDGESAWDDYAATLGVADYQLRTSSDLSPSVLFQKFLADAAAHTCAEWVRAYDTSFFEAGAQESTAQDDVRANIIGLRWRIQGRPRTEEAAVVDDYVNLFATVYRRSGEPEEAWQTVCVAMFTHPDFFTY